MKFLILTVVCAAAASPPLPGNLGEIAEKVGSQIGINIFGQLDRVLKGEIPDIPGLSVGKPEKPTIPNDSSHSGHVTDEYNMGGRYGKKDDETQGSGRVYEKEETYSREETVKEEEQGTGYSGEYDNYETDGASDGDDYFNQDYDRK